MLQPPTFLDHVGIALLCFVVAHNGVGSSIINLTLDFGELLLGAFENFPLHGFSLC